MACSRDDAFSPAAGARKGRIGHIAFDPVVHACANAELAAYTTSKHGVLGFTARSRRARPGGRARQRHPAPASSRRRSTKKCAPPSRSWSRSSSTTRRRPRRHAGRHRLARDLLASDLSAYVHWCDRDGAGGYRTDLTQRHAVAIAMRLSLALCCAPVPRIAAAQTPPDKQSVLARLQAYYGLRGHGLISFQCDVTPD